ncbi:relaxase/mobilization nuclease domain-containing protein [Streptomyces sp. NPDC090306]|uniref:relaxase/mobilization nuclease domain-containing protein n=1 Tax=Streptomyces sp. NPDC090306 TaxID=3365961 RepID=UPI00382EC542
MNPNVTRGSRTHGLLAYLYGPGRHNEHTDPHLVGSFDGFAPDPGRERTTSVKELAAVLDLRVKQLGDRLQAKYVWHCSVRTAPEDRQLTDTEWDMVARRILAAVGIAADNDPDACRWVAVRHADDHIHIAATLVRADGRKVFPRNDYPKAQSACRDLEKELGLRRLNPGDRTAAKRATAAELRKAERLGQHEPPRDTLRTAVRQSLAGATTEQEFLDRLDAASILVRLRKGPSGDVLGYSVALPEAHDAGQPVWFAGATLAPDLSLPKIRARLVGAVEPRGLEAARSARPAAARRRAIGSLDRTLHILDANEDQAADDLIGTGAVLDALAATASPTTRTEYLAAARTFERATRSHTRAENADRHALRSAARGIARAGTATHGDDSAAATILSTLVLVAIAAAHWHSARGHAQQASAAREAALHLRAAYERTAHHPMNALRARAAALPAAERTRHNNTIRTLLAARCPTVAAPGPMPALVASLAEAEAAGHVPENLLQRAIEQRELTTADNVEDVLVWRIRRIARLPAPTAATAETTPTPWAPEAVKTPRSRPVR